MARGGRYPGAGRPKGATDKKTKLIAAAIAESMAAGKKISPLEVITEAMQLYYDIYRNTKQEEGKFLALRTSVEYAEKAAPYLHARLASTTIGGDAKNPIVLNLIDDIR